MNSFIKLLLVLALSGNVLLYPIGASAESVCFDSEQATDLIQILDSSDSNIELLDNCSSLVDQLYNEIKIRDEVIIKLTEENINLRQELRGIKKKREREKYLRYAGIGAIVFAIIKIASAAASL